jgi:hypothetical protein
MTASPCNSGVVATPAAALAPATSADARLIALCAQHIRNYDAVKCGPDDDDPSVAQLWAAYNGTHKEICEAKPQTIAGVLAKARAALVEARVPDGRFVFGGSSGERWACDLTLDIVRLADEGRLA